MQHNLNSVYAEFLKNLSITALNPMQETVIERTATSNHVMLVSPTGTGKTLGFLISIVQKFKPVQGVQAIVVAPSRELALQIESVFKNMKTGYKVTCCYGGHDFKVEQDSLRDAPALLIATPGRLADHLERRSFDPKTVNLVVLDEFDKSLQLGFHDQVEVLFEALRGDQHHILTSATHMDKLPDFLPFKKTDVLDFSVEETNQNFQLKLVQARSTDKAEALLRLVAGFNQEVCLVFCNHREAVERISQVFQNYKMEHGIFHGAMEQIDREKNLIKYRGGAHNILIATDLAARGLDIPEIKHVVHYQMPPKEDAFIHRNGRTARMHAEGQGYLIQANDEALPEYLSQRLEEITLPATLKLPPPPAYTCIYISAGKKDKVSKGDVAGLFMKKGELTKDELGLITVLDYATYVSVKRSRAADVVNKLKEERIKKMKVKIEVAS